MPHITNPVFAGSRLRELDTDQLWMKYTPNRPEGGLEGYQFDPNDPKINTKIDQLRMHLLGYISLGECTLLTDEEQKLLALR